MAKSIAILGPSWPFRGGIAASSELLARAWQAKGDQVSLHTFTKQYPAFLFPGSTQFTETPKPDDLTIYRTLHGYQPINWFKAGKVLAKAKYDLLLIRYWLPALAPALGTVASIVKRHSDTRICALVDNLFPHEARPLDQYLSRNFIRQPDAFLTLSNIVKDQLVDLVDKPICYTPHPVYDSYGPLIDQTAARRRLQLPEGQDYPLLLFFGFIRKYKGLDLLLSALKSDRLRASNLKLVIAGEWYDNKDDYASLLHDPEIADKIILRDRFIPDSEIATYLSAVDAVVQPYRSATQSGISAIAYAYDKPLISTNVGGLAEIIDEARTGFLCNPDSEDIASAIQRWLQMPDREAMGTAIAEKKKAMSWTSCVDAIERCVGWV